MWHKIRCFHNFCIFYTFPRLRARFENSLKIGLQLHWEARWRNNAFCDRFCGHLGPSWEPLGDLLAPRWAPEGPKECPSHPKNLHKSAQDAPKRPSRPPQRSPRGPQGSPRGPQGPPRGPQEAPKTPQEVHKRPQRPPKRSQKGCVGCLNADLVP